MSSKHCPTQQFYLYSTSACVHVDILHGWLHITHPARKSRETRPSHDRLSTNIEPHVGVHRVFKNLLSRQHALTNKAGGRRLKTRPNVAKPVSRQANPAQPLGLCGMTGAYSCATPSPYWLAPSLGLPRPPAPPLERLRSRIVLYNSSPANPGRLWSPRPRKWRPLRSRSPLGLQSPSFAAQSQVLLDQQSYTRDNVTGASDK